MHCRHDIHSRSKASNETNNGNIGSTYVINTTVLPEKQFEPWNLDASNNRHAFQNFEQSQSSSYVRDYGWDEIEQDEEKAKRLRQLLALWNAERIAILKLQYDLDKNIFKRMFDCAKRIGHSIRLALWLWVHRPITCENISMRTPCEIEQPIVDPITNLYKSQNATSSLNPDVANSYASDLTAHTTSMMLSNDIFADSLWYQRFVMDASCEYLPPIARAMKNMLDNNAFIWNPSFNIENVWPHFVNENRMQQNQAFFRNLHRSTTPLSTTFQKPLSSHNVNIKEYKLKRTSKTARQASPSKIQTTMAQTNQTLLTNRINNPAKQKKSPAKRKHSIHEKYLLKPPENLYNNRKRSIRKKQRSNRLLRLRSKLEKQAYFKSSGSKSRPSSNRRNSKRRTSPNRRKSKRHQSPNRTKAKSSQSPNRRNSKRRKSHSRRKSKHRKSSNRMKSKSRQINVGSNSKRHRSTSSSKARRKDFSNRKSHSKTSE